MKLTSSVVVVVIALGWSRVSLAQPVGSMELTAICEVTKHVPKHGFNYFVGLLGERRSDCQLMAFRLPKDNTVPVRNTWDTSGYFRVWCRHSAGVIEEIWFDWSVDGHLPSEARPVANDLLILDRRRHGKLTDVIGESLRGRPVTIEITGKPSSVRPTDFPEKPVFCNPPPDFVNLIVQAVRLGQLVQCTNSRLLVGMIDCEIPALLQFQNQLFLLARVGDGGFLLTNHLQESLPLIFCEPRGVVFTPSLESSFWREVSARGNRISAVGGEGYSFLTQDQRGAVIYATLRHIDRLSARRFHFPLSSPPKWAATLSSYSKVQMEQMRPMGAERLAALTVCSPQAWQEEFQLPVDPELLFLDGDWK